MAEERGSGVPQTSSGNLRSDQISAVNSITPPGQGGGNSGPDSIFTPISTAATAANTSSSPPPGSSTISQQIQQEQVDASPMSSQLNKMLKRNKKDTEKKFLLNDEDFN